MNPPFGTDLQVFWEYGERVFYRAWRLRADGARRPVLGVGPAAARPPPTVLNRLAHEFELRDDLDADWAVRPLELRREGDRTLLLLEDPGGEPLERLLGAPMDTERFLHLAIGIAVALSKAHERGLVHKDVKPANIWVNCEDGQVRLSGFGIASKLPRDLREPEPPEFIRGSLAYMAPEQTGRMNGSINSRGDLYALGVTFYQMLSGRLGFNAGDPVEWVHSHIARRPAAPAERLESIPTPVPEIVMKLLAKTPEERYQTAAGVEHDLRRCLADWELNGRIEPFVLGERDRPDRLMSSLAEEPALGPTSTIARPAEHLDLATAIKVWQAVSGEIVLEKLIDTLMRTAIEQAGAERGLLIRPRGIEQRIEAEATTSGNSVIVQLRDEQAVPTALPESMLHYVLRTGESVILDAAEARSAFGEDPYIRERQTRSIFCLPLINQGKLNGVLYLESNLTRSAFAPARIAVLKLLAGQAAISLERATLYQALQESEQRFRDYAETASDWYWETDTDHKFTRMKDYEELRALGRLPLTSRIGLTRWDFAKDVESQPEKWELHRSMLDARQPFRDFVYPAVRFNGSLMYVKVSGKPCYDAKGAFLGYRGTGNDVTAAVRADQAEAALRHVQAELAHVARVTTLGELAASIAHEVNQPIAATLMNAEAALSFLCFDPPELDEVREALEWIVRDAARAGAVVQRIRNLVKKAPQPDDCVEINAVIQEVIELTRGEAMKNGVLVRTELADSLPLVRGDRVELQQVILNLVVNAVEAMSALTEAPRELQIATSRTESDHVLITVRDTGPGLAPAGEKHLFKAFHTTKPNGLGLGLSICRSIVESRGGRMWASANAPRGAVFQFTLPVHPVHPEIST